MGRKGNKKVSGPARPARLRYPVIDSAPKLAEFGNSDPSATFDDVRAYVQNPGVSASDLGKQIADVFLNEAPLIDAKRRPHQGGSTVNIASVEGRDVVRRFAESAGLSGLLQMAAFNQEIANGFVLQLVKRVKSGTAIRHGESRPLPEFQDPQKVLNALGDAWQFPHRNSEAMVDLLRVFAPLVTQENLRGFISQRVAVALSKIEQGRNGDDQVTSQRRLLKELRAVARSRGKFPKTTFVSGANRLKIGMNEARFIKHDHVSGAPEPSPKPRIKLKSTYQLRDNKSSWQPLMNADGKRVGAAVAIAFRGDSAWLEVSRGARRSTPLNNFKQVDFVYPVATVLQDALRTAGMSDYASTATRRLLFQLGQRPNIGIHNIDDGIEVLGEGGVSVVVRGKGLSIKQENGGPQLCVERNFLTASTQVASHVPQISIEIRSSEAAELDISHLGRATDSPSTRTL